MTSLALPGSVSASQSTALDVVFSSNDGSQLCIISGEENWPDSGWTPIGIVIVPGTHNRYGDGSCGVISINGMSTNYPEIGQRSTGSTLSNDSEIGMSKGNYKGRFPSSVIPTNLFSSASAFGTSTGTAYTPRQSSSEGTGQGFASGSSTSNRYYWPYINTSNLGPQTQYANEHGYVEDVTGQAACDFNGIRNTAAIYSYYKSSTQWTSTSVDASATTPIEIVAPACVGRYKTIGTLSFLDVYGDISTVDLNYGTPSNVNSNTGFWYMPSLGELSYISRYRYTIRNTLSSLFEKYGNVRITQMNVNIAYLSSTGNNSGGIWELDNSGGSLNRTVSDPRVRAFMRL